MALLDGERLDMFAILTQSICVTDGRMDKITMASVSLCNVLCSNKECLLYHLNGIVIDSEF